MTGTERRMVARLTARPKFVIPLAELSSFELRSFSRIPLARRRPLIGARVVLDTFFWGDFVKITHFSPFLCTLPFKNMKSFNHLFLSDQ